MVISGGDDGTVRVWDLATGTPVGDPFTGHTGAVNAVAVGGAATAARWSSPAARRHGAGVGPGHRHPGRRPVHRPHRLGERGGGRRELDGRPVVVSGSDDGTVRVWELATGTPVGDPFTGHTGSVTAVAVRAAMAARWWSPAATMARCGCGTWPPAPRSATRSPATPAR